VLEIVKEVKKSVHIENRLKFYYRESLGLHIAVQTGATDYIQEGDFKFYSHLIQATNGQVIEGNESEGLDS